MILHPPAEKISDTFILLESFTSSKPPERNKRDETLQILFLSFLQLTVFIINMIFGSLNERQFDILNEFCDLRCKQSESPRGMLGKPLISAGKHSCSRLPRRHVDFFLL